MPSVIVQLVDLSGLLDVDQDLFVALVVHRFGSTRSCLPFKGPSSQLLIRLTQQRWFDMRLLEPLLLNNSFQVLDSQFIVLLGAYLDDTVIYLNFDLHYLVIQLVFLFQKLVTIFELNVSSSHFVHTFKLLL